MSTSARPAALPAALQFRWDATTTNQLLELGPLGRHTAATWLQHVRAATGPAQDELLHALLRSADDGEVAAVDVLLQALTPAVRRATERLRSLDELAPHDRGPAAASAAWEAVRCYRLQSTTHVFITLLRDARRVLAPAPTANQRYIADKTTAVDTADLTDLAGAQLPRRPPAEVRLAALIAWARHTRVLHDAEIDLLLRVTLSGEPASHIAHELDTTVASLRKRVQRIQARLTTAVQAQP